jgi:hypothetical protein
MSYAQLVEAHHKLSYSNNVKMVAQQVRGVLRLACGWDHRHGIAQRVLNLLSDHLDVIRV